jgi:hypothetical protein
VQRIELITQNQAQSFHDVATVERWRRQRSEQYFTLGHSFAHFFRQANRRPQTAQDLDGKKAFGCIKTPAGFVSSRRQQFWDFGAELVFCASRVF